MTREEAFKTASEFYGDKQNSYSMINIIYDDLANQTCENCKYFTERDDISHLCTMGNSCGIDEYGIPTVLRTWGCNEWETK